MADVHISIPTPVLVGGQSFKVEYSLDGVNYTLWGYETNTPFTVTGLTAGEFYYFRFTLVKSLSPLVECDPVVKTYFIPEEQPCETVSAAIEENDTVYQLVVNFSVSSPVVTPCGGWVLKYGKVGTTLTSLQLSSLSPNPMYLPASNDSYKVELYAVDCNGNLSLCDQVIAEPPFVACESATLLSADLQYNNGAYELVLTVIPPTPAVNTFTIVYNQVNALSSGLPDNGIIAVNATGANPQVITIPLNPNFNLYAPVISYAGSITDGCGGTLGFDKSLSLG